MTKLTGKFSGNFWLYIVCMEDFECCQGFCGGNSACHHGCLMRLWMGHHLKLSGGDCTVLVNHGGSKWK